MKFSCRPAVARPAKSKFLVYVAAVDNGLLSGCNAPDNHNNINKMFDACGPKAVLATGLS
jgi:hypothetical protein